MPSLADNVETPVILDLGTIRNEFTDFNPGFDGGQEKELFWRTPVSDGWWRDERMKLSDLLYTLLHSDWRV